LIYGGQKTQQRENFRIYPVTAMDEMLDALNRTGFVY